MPPNLVTDAALREELDVFQQIMVDIFQRRAVFEGMEDRMLDRTLADDTTYRIYIADYVGSQLADLRKFFEQDGRAYKVSNLIGRLPIGNATKTEHDRLHDVWKSDYVALANQYFFHRQKGAAPPTSVMKARLNAFMEDMNSMIETLVGELTAANYDVASLQIGTDAPYYKDVRTTANKFFEWL